MDPGVQLPINYRGRLEMKLTWRDVFFHNHRIWIGGQIAVRTAAKQACYPCYTWNAQVFDTDTGNLIGTYSDITPQPLALTPNPQNVPDHATTLTLLSTPKEVPYHN